MSLHFRYPMIIAALLACTWLPPAAAQPEVRQLADEVAAWRADHEQAIVDDFLKLLAIPNVASDQPNIERNAKLIESMLAQRGVTTELLRVDGAPPVVYGELLSPGATRTLMVYVHYDGQPVEPADWSSDPWQPIIRDGLIGSGEVSEVAPRAPFDPDWRIYARSAGDDKAPVVAIVHALDALAALGVRPTVNLKFFFEGEEEAGSPHLQQYLERYRDQLDADLWLFCDGPMHPSRRPQLAYGVRGVTGFELTVYGPARPLHSGHYGNWAPNPIAMLTQLLASMRNDDGEVLIEDFYAQVAEPTRAELAAIDAIPRTDLVLRDDLALGRTEGGGERVELAILKPALNFRGISGGSTGAKARNTIVTQATAALGIRMVPDQTVEFLKDVVQRHLASQGYHVVTAEPDPETLRGHERVVRLVWKGGYPAVRTAFDHPIAEDLAELMNRWSGGDLVQLPTMGGSLPLYVIRDTLDAPVLILPVANHDNNQHGKDENLRIGNLWDAIELYALTFARLGQ